MGRGKKPQAPSTLQSMPLATFWGLFKLRDKYPLKNLAICKNSIELACDGLKKAQAVMLFVLSCVWVTELMSYTNSASRVQFLQRRAITRQADAWDKSLEIEHAITGAEIASTVTGVSADVLDLFHYRYHNDFGSFPTLSEEEHAAILDQVNMWLKKLECQPLQQLPERFYGRLPSIELEKASTITIGEAIAKLSAVPIIKTEPISAVATAQIPNKEPKVERTAPSAEELEAFPLTDFVDLPKFHAFMKRSEEQKLTKAEVTKGKAELKEEAVRKQLQAIYAARDALLRNLEEEEDEDSFAKLLRGAEAATKKQKL